MGFFAAFNIHNGIGYFSMIIYWNLFEYQEYSKCFVLQLEAKKEEREAKKDLPPVKEPDISGSGKDPNNSSGCVIS
jgi:hypothetical protein